jgi:hypothetical protein
MGKIRLLKGWKRPIHAKFGYKLIDPNKLQFWPPSELVTPDVS